MTSPLFPRDKGNQDGTKPILGNIYTHAHRIFAAQSRTC